MSTLILCAELDERGGFIGMVEIDPENAGPQHVVTITECDLPTDGSYFWVPDPANAFGGKFEPNPDIYAARGVSALKAKQARRNQRS